MPQSPPPSNSGDHLQQDTHHLLQHNSNMGYPQERFQHDEGVHLRSDHGSPHLKEEPDAYRGQHGPYSYQHQYHDSGIEVQYDGYSQDYNGIGGQDRYSTPAMSSSSMSPPSMNTTDVLRTRSGLGIQRGQQILRPKPATQNTIEKPPKAKKAKKEKVKAEKKVPRLDKPLSELTKDWKNVAVVDIDAYVNRSADERRREVTEGKVPGKVKRPMNSFMLYRKAYQNRTKDWCLQNNHQVVSQVCGDSWPLEPDEVREQFNEWARVERANHQNAHPGYKFSPTKPGVGKGTKRKPSEAPSMSEESELDDYDWQSASSRRTKRSKETPTPIRDMPVAYPTTRSAYQYSSRESSVDPNYRPYNISSFHASNPGRAPPPQYQANLPPGQYWQMTSRPHPTMAAAEDIIHTATVSPGENVNFLGLPGGHEFDMMSVYGQYEGPPPAPEQKIDPSLLSPSHGLYIDGGYGSRTIDGIYLGDTQYGQKYTVGYDVADPSLVDPAMPYMEPEHNQDGMPLNDPHMDILGGREAGWSMLEDCSEFDKWNHPE
ncbi:Uncharacterized protein BP5553_01932 [Venustampulla echinocandica]|uniref:HMG box domain-containing protein n=1 Tax=Venustampulla echinocandica TaxID=2656787 RepID=A0A370U2L7_9HELO|nr:Uncharacterized protein BP5553_01932 [Venustampulla echinocandica]RDL41953.1 Uncharacterized protein BP5553_01932 [Venustampulla echinocandica]